MWEHGSGDVMVGQWGQQVTCPLNPPPHVSLQVSQLRHELSMKDELLQFYTRVTEESEPESACSTP